MFASAALLEEQSAALHALGSYAENAPHGFAPYIEKILPLVLQLCEYYHDTVREEAFTVLGDILHSAREHFPTGSPGLLQIWNSWHDISCKDAIFKLAKL